MPVSQTQRESLVEPFWVFLNQVLDCELLEGVRMREGMTQPLFLPFLYLYDHAETSPKVVALLATTG
jgi:hypothetical protein